MEWSASSISDFLIPAENDWAPLMQGGRSRPAWFQAKAELPRSAKAREIRNIMQSLSCTGMHAVTPATKLVRHRRDSSLKLGPVLCVMSSAVETSGVWAVKLWRPLRNRALTIYYPLGTENTGLSRRADGGGPGRDQVAQPMFGTADARHADNTQRIRPGRLLRILAKNDDPEARA